MKRFYRVTRDLHLYCGLFISPLVLAYAVSIFFLVHAWIPGAARQPAMRTAAGLTIPDGVERLTGRTQVTALRGVLDRLGVHGEVNFVRFVSRDKHLIIPVNVPGREMTVDLNLPARSAVVTERSTGFSGAVVFLHKMPGQHLAAFRGNSLFMRIWKPVADGTVYLVLFLTLSGIYLWFVLRAERRIGLALLAAGAVSFFGLIYAVIR